MLENSIGFGFSNRYLLLLIHGHEIRSEEAKKRSDIGGGDNAPFLTRIVESGESDLKVEESQANLASLTKSGGKPDPDHPSLIGAVSFV